MSIDIERLKSEPDYWDKNAPEDATHYCPVAKLFYNDSYPIAPCCIRRPTKPAAPEWDGEGLPPVGCKCEYSLKGGDGPWFKCEIISHNRLVIRCPHLQDDSDNGLQVVDRKVVFRPIRTQAERDRDDLVKTVGLHLAGDPQEIADAIIAAGWRKGE